MKEKLKEYLDARDLLARTNVEIERIKKEGKEGDFTKSLLELANYNFTKSRAALAKAMDDACMPTTEWTPPPDDDFWKFNQDSGRQARVTHVATNGGVRVLVRDTHGRVRFEAKPEARKPDRPLVELYQSFLPSPDRDE